MSENINDYVIIDEEPKSLIDKMKSIPMSYYLVGANIVVFLLIHLSNLFLADNLLLALLMKNTPAIALEGQVYRLFTAVFTHSELMHIAGNCMGILLLGRPIEQIFGKWKFLIIFIVSGLFGSLASFMFSPLNAIGASGGVFGLFGVHIYLLMKNKTVYLKVFGNEIFKLLAINVFIGFTVSGIDYYGHFGGILGGFLATLALGLGHKIKFNSKTLAISFLTILLFVGSFTYIDNNYTTFAQELDTHISNANDALNRNDYAALKITRDELADSVPLLPPIPAADNILDQIDTFIKEAE